MGTRALLLIMVLATVASCGRIADSRLNPFNWFGRDRAIETTAPTVVVARDPRPLVDQVVSVTIEQAPGGAILKAIGLPPTQGHWGASLVPADATQPGVLVYQFRLVPPRQQTRVSTPQSRQVIVAAFLTDQTLAGIREIQVLGARSSRAVRR